MGAYQYEALPVAEWFRRNREIAGFHNPARALYQTVRELVENSLDATEPYNILPTVRLSIGFVDERKGWLSIYSEDNGIGIPRDEIPNVFGKVFYSSKYRIKQHRGVFGLGIKMVVLYAQTTTNRPVQVRSATPNSDHIYEYEIQIDTVNNEPVILSYRELENRYGWHGTAVGIVIEGDWHRSKKRVEEYLRRTAMISPYAEFYLVGPDMELHIPRRTTKLPQPPKEGLPHPKSVDVETMKQMLASNSDNETVLEFLVNSFDGVGETLASSFLQHAGVSPNVRIGDLTQEEITHLVSKMKEFEGWRRPRSDWLSPVGPELLELGVKHSLNAEVVYAVTRKPSSYSGHPFIVEAAVAYGGEVPPVDRPLLYRYANKIPLIYDEGSDVARKVVDEIDWSVYKVKFPAPLAVVIHICSTKIPYASAGKEAIAEVPEIEDEMNAAVREAARKLRTYLSRKEREQELLLRYVTFSKYVPEVSSALSYVTGVERERLEESLRRLIEEKLGLTPRAVMESISGG